MEQLATSRPRIGPGEAAGAPPHGVLDRLTRLRRRIAARVRGEQDLPGLLAQGLQVGREVYIARGFYFDPGFAWLISIDDESTVGPNVTILTHDATPKLRTGYSVIAPVRIGARVFIGANVTILPGTEIGDDAIVGAGSVVRRNVAAGAVVFGNPAAEVASTDAHTERHLAELQRRPRYSLEGSEGLANMAPAARRMLLDQLKDGSAYVD